MDWYVIDRRRTGTSAKAGRSRRRRPASPARTGAGPAAQPIQGWTAAHQVPVDADDRRPQPRGAESAAVRIAIDGRPIDELTVPPGFFLRMLIGPGGTLAGAGDYATADRRRRTATDVAIEQFDAQPAGRLVFGFGDGWHELEYNPSTGRLWRWMSERAVLRVRSDGQPAVLTAARARSEPSADRSRVIVRVGRSRGGRRAGAGGTFRSSVAIPADAVRAGREPRSRSRPTSRTCRPSAGSASRRSPASGPATSSQLHAASRLPSQAEQRAAERVVDDAAATSSRRGARRSAAR